MNRGRVYSWTPDPSTPLHGTVRTKRVALRALDEQGQGKGRLWGKFVRVRNAGWVKEQDSKSGAIRAVPLGNAQADANGDFFFYHGRGGPRADNVELHEFQDRYICAARFGEVNTYYHITRIARRVHRLLAELGAPLLPRVVAVINAHSAATDDADGIRDGVFKNSERWLPFQGGHYRLASRHYDIPEHEPVSPDGEIHLGAGWQLWTNGALFARKGEPYRANASHNAGIIYHEYGHHITRHTADFRGNDLRPPNHQDNRKSPIDEGTSDYWAATMLETPHIWAWHQAHDDRIIHPRSLASKKSMDDYDHDRSADPHLNGTIWGAALWDLRVALSECEPNGARQTDLLLLQALLFIGKMMGEKNPPTAKTVREVRGSYSVGLSALLRADEILFNGRRHDLILEIFRKRGIAPKPEIQRKVAPPKPLQAETAASKPGAVDKARKLECSAGFQPAVSPISNRQRVPSPAPSEYSSALQAGSTAIQQVGNLRYEVVQSPDKPVRASLSLSRDVLLASSSALHGMLAHVAPEEIPETEDLFSGQDLQKHLQELHDLPLSLVAAGDIMLGGRSRKFINAFGAEYPFEAVRPLLRRAPIGLANLEGPIARQAEKEERTYSYRVKPRLTKAMHAAGINVVTLANNHLLDCGRQGVLETLRALAEAGVAAIGAGVNKQAAHTPVIVQAGSLRVGLLGYYWNRRTSARGPWPGSAMDPPEDLAADIGGLKPKVDRIVATFHWGVPYVREPSDADRAKARFAVQCGADIVIGHHPHIVQPFEIYGGRPIFYSLGNFTFGSGNSRGESLLLGVRFEQSKTVVHVYPAYVKNRDPRVNYQPKVLRGNGAQRILQALMQISGDDGTRLKIENSRGVLELQR